MSIMSAKPKITENQMRQHAFSAIAHNVKKKKVRCLTVCLVRNVHVLEHQILKMLSLAAFILTCMQKYTF